MFMVCALALDRQAESTRRMTSVTGSMLHAVAHACAPIDRQSRTQSEKRLSGAPVVAYPLTELLLDHMSV